MLMYSPLPKIIFHPAFVRPHKKVRFSTPLVIGRSKKRDTLPAHPKDDARCLTINDDVRP